MLESVFASSAPVIGAATSQDDSVDNVEISSNDVFILCQIVLLKSRTLIPKVCALITYLLVYLPINNDKQALVLPFCSQTIPEGFTMSVLSLKALWINPLVVVKVPVIDND